MHALYQEEFTGRCDSLYRLILACARRAVQLSKPDARALVPVRSRKTTIIALEEVIQGKLEVRSGPIDDTEFVE